MVQKPGGTAQSRASPASNTTNSNNNQSNASRTTKPAGGNGYQPPPPVHLSAMRSPPLQLSSVERRGQLTASRETRKSFRPHGLQEAPTYRPTEEEFRDPFAYINKIKPEASRYGICKIIPPDTWNPDFAIDTENFHFRTRKQELNSVEGSTRANLTYLDQLSKFHKQLGNNLNRFPSVDKRPLDLYKLRKAVETRGGFDKVCKSKRWAEIGRDLGYSGKIMSSLSTSLRNSYQRWLFPYEEYLRLAKPGVHQQLEFEYGGPLTPSPANSPAKRSSNNTPSSLRAESPAMRASEALNASMRNSSEGDRATPAAAAAAADLPPPPPRVSSGFTPVNPGGGFTPVNASTSTSTSAFTPVNNNQKRERERERERETDRSSALSPSSRRNVADSPGAASTKNTPDYRSLALSGTPITGEANPNPLKRQLSHDSVDSRKENQSGQEENENGGRRSKRLKKDNVPTVAGSHMTLFRPLTPRVPGENGSFTPGEKCEQCGKGDDALSTLLVCESCDHGYHMRCLDPPMTQKPDFDWNCSRCLVGDGQFGFEEGGIYSLKQFQEKAADFKEGYFQNKMPFDPVLNCPRPVTEEDIEREFWRLVASLEETVEVEYGADIHSTTHGSGFPTMEKCPKDPYSTDPWNLNIMPLHQDSLFRHIKSDISGMTVPWLYVGMIFSTFCWHNEDHYAYSANYQHFGSTKTWYGIPGEDAEKFENAMREAVPELFETQPDLLFQLVTLLTPEQLRKADVNVYALDQRAGQFVITFPQAYHAGFNHGFNFNEAVNFAPSDWEPAGDAGVERLQQFRRQPCFSHDELLWTAAEGAATGGVTIQTAKWLAPALERMRFREIDQRKAFVDKHREIKHACPLAEDVDAKESTCQIEFVIDEEDVPEEEYQCAYCKAYAYLSRFKCRISGKVLCLLHAGNHDCCEMPEAERYTGKEHTLHYRRTEEAIVNIYQKVDDKAHLPEQWEEKYQKVLDEDDRPSLKVLKTLLHEGEKIPYDLPSLPILKTFVDRCVEWVDKAMDYIVRKQQNRRKNDKVWRKGSKVAEMEERDREFRKVENVFKLLREADQIGFECPEITQLAERAEAIVSFQREAKLKLEYNYDKSDSSMTQEFEELVDRGKAFNIDMPELERLEKIVLRLKWNDEVNASQGVFLTLQDVIDLIERGVRVEVPPFNEALRRLREQKEAGELWERKAKELMSVELVHYPQLQALSTQAQIAGIPVTPETLASVEQILDKQREAHRQIVSLYERSKDSDPSKRPRYSEVRDTMDQLTELNSKPNGTLDLEKEQKRHEDWMRKGKKLFGKANAPLHILKSHMEYVLDRNQDCFDINSDKPRVPAEPASREPSPSEMKLHSWEDPRFREVFCICRRVEAGMMIECEICHEWYHGKCLKIARGKLKDEDKYTCPICDWRVKIPRDAARPKLEDLTSWYEEIPNLPFQPDEDKLLEDIINNAQEFRMHVMPFCNPLMVTSTEAETQRFYLRKIEGAEILLAYETNYFRQELHKWSPVAPHAPPVLESSKSTRKPRPTKLQKLMAQHGVDDPQALPQSLRTKPHVFKRKSSETGSSISGRPQALQPAPAGRSESGTPTTHAFPAIAQQQQQQPGMTHTSPVLSGMVMQHHDHHGHHHGGGHHHGHHQQPPHPHQHPHHQPFSFDPQYSMSPHHNNGNGAATSIAHSAFTPHALHTNAGSVLSPTFVSPGSSGGGLYGPKVGGGGGGIFGGGGGGGGKAVGSSYWARGNSPNEVGAGELESPSREVGSMGSNGSIVLGGGLGGGGGGGGGLANSQSNGNIDKIFHDLTNQDDEGPLSTTTTTTQAQHESQAANDTIGGGGGGGSDREGKVNGVAGEA